MPRKATVDTLPENPWQEWAMEHKVAVTVGEDSSVLAYASSDTKQVVGIIEGTTLAWEVYAITVMPSRYDQYPTLAAAQMRVDLQVLLDDVATMQYHTDPTVFASGGYCHQFVTTGGLTEIWPHALGMVRPKPLIAETITCLMKHSNNDAGYVGLSYFFDFWYSVFPVDASAVMAYLRSTGQI